MTGTRPYTAPPRSTFWQKLGPGGLASFLLATTGALALVGLPVAWRLRQVLRDQAGDPLRGSDLILVLGRRLQDDGLTAVFEARLAHAESLWRQGFAPRILVAGGLTGTARATEAAAGRDWLLARGIPPEAVLTEDQSQHTLENLFHVRETLRGRGWGPPILVPTPCTWRGPAPWRRGWAWASGGAPPQDVLHHREPCPGSPGHSWRPSSCTGTTRAWPTAACWAADGSWNG